MAMCFMFPIASFTAKAPLGIPVSGELNLVAKENPSLLNDILNGDAVTMGQKGFIKVWPLTVLTILSGLIALLSMFLYKNRRILRNYKSALQNIGFVLIVNLLLGLNGGIDNWGHIGGLLGGLLLSWLCGPEIAFLLDESTRRPVMVDTVPRSRREISCLLVTLFFAAAAYAL